MYNLSDISPCYRYWFQYDFKKFYRKLWISIGLLLSKHNIIISIFVTEFLSDTFPLTFVIDIHFRMFSLIFIGNFEFLSDSNFYRIVVIHLYCEWTSNSYIINVIMHHLSSMVLTNSAFRFLSERLHFYRICKVTMLFYEYYLFEWNHHTSVLLKLLS